MSILFLGRIYTHAQVKEDVLGTLDFDHFTTKQLASDVRKSGLYPADMIIERMEQLFDNKNSEFETLSAKEKEIRKEKDQLTTDMKTVKINLNKNCYVYDGTINPWTYYIDMAVKARYINL